ncbi:Hypothetical predicted protein [Paramuricea clavata]|uniref:P2X purinoreceptor 7 intracellular domain-containing protein n=1 Tax=Paramuricea clavata TaxID=317549 RepID=A0A6S7FHK9_PARCT|nr:Hypothetical predicted protein [Paramuricea clavata]
MSDSDSDYAVSVYDPEDNLNCYGSPIESHNQFQLGEVASTANAFNASTASASTIVEKIQPQRTKERFCKNTCSRRSGQKKRCCPSHDENLHCTDKCSCGSKKSSCKNQEQSTAIATNANAGKNAFDRHQAAIEVSNREITDFIGGLSDAQKDNILLNLLSNGKGSLDYAKNLVKYGTGDAVPPVPDGKPTWCVCGVCRVMPTEEENKYCGKIRCVTSFVTFQNTCTDRDVLLIAIRARYNIRVEDPDCSTNSYSKAAYRQYILWRYKKLGRGNRRVCPSCVVLTIRHIFPADDGNYMGFRRA